MPTQAHAEELNYRRMLESSPDCVIRYDLKGRISYMTPGLLGFLGISAAEVLGKLPSEAWPDGRFAAIEKAANQALQTGEQTLAEIRAADSDGETYIKQIDVIPERNEAGQLVGTIAFGRSITALREAEDDIRHFVDNLPGIAYTFRISPDGHGSFPFISSGIEDFYGLKPEDVRHDMMPLHLLAHPDDRPLIEAALAESARTLSPYHMESRICRPGLPIRWLEMHSMPERDTDGGTLWHGIMLDITARKQLEADQQEHLRHFQSMDRVNRAMQGTNDLNKMMRNVLEVVRAIFDCDRVFVLTPCDPDATEWSVPMECTKPEYPGALTLGLTVPMEQDVANVMRITLSTDSPVAFGEAAEYPLPASAAKQFGIQSKMNMALRPKLGAAWLFGIHQCTYARVWTPAEVRLLHEIGLRLQDGLTSLLMFQELSASEKKFRSLAENMPDNVVRYDRQARTIYVNPKLERTLGIVAAKMIGTTIRELHPNGEYEDYANLLDTVLTRGQSGEIEKVALTPDGETSVHLIRVIPERNESGEIIGAIAIGRDITQLKREEEVLQLAYHDTLTDLPNRRLLLDRLKHTMSASKRSRRYVALMFVDLDNFKPLNDKYGHDVGDLLLIEVAHRIASCVRDADTVARFGGDEFVVLLSDLDTESANAIAQARIVAEKIRTSLARPYLLEIQQEGKPSITVEYRCTSSIGTVVAVNHEVSAEDLLKRADLAMYQAKETGRDRVCFYDAKQ